MKYLKKHRFTTQVIIAFTVVVLILAFVWRAFFSNGGNPVYGNRLDGMEKVEISKKTIDEVSSELKKNDKVKKVTSNISGKTFDIVITVNDDVSLSSAKEIGNNSFSKLSEDQINYYSIQVFIKKDDEKKNDFPIIGYKQRGTKTLIWTKDRQVTSDEK